MADANHVYMRVTGKIQGTFKGPISRKDDDRGDNWFELFSIVMPKGKPWRKNAEAPSPTTIQVVKFLDSMAFARAQGSSEYLSLVEIDLVGRDGYGPTNRGQVRMKDALIAGYQQKTWDAKAMGSVESFQLNVLYFEWNTSTPDGGFGPMPVGLR